MKLFAKSLLFFIMAIVGPGCSRFRENQIENEQYMVQLESLERRNHILQQEFRNWEIDNLTGQQFEGLAFEIKKLKDINSDKTFKVHDILGNREQLIILYIKQSEEDLYKLIPLLNAFSETSKPVLITDASVYLKFRAKYGTIELPFDVFYLVWDECMCKLLYNDNLLFVLDSDGKMKNVYSPSGKKSDFTLLYLNMIKNRYFSTNMDAITMLPELHLGRKNREGKFDTIVLSKMEEEKSLVGFIIHSKDLKREQTIFFSLDNSGDKLKTLGCSRAFGYVAYLDSNRVVKQVARQRDYLDIENLAKQTRYFIAAGNSETGRAVSLADSLFYLE